MSEEVKKNLKIAAIVVAVLAVFSAIIAYIYITNMNKVGFLPKTTLNGNDIEGKSVDDLTKKEKEWMDSLKVEITENDKEALLGSLADFGYSFDEDAFRETLADIDKQQKTNIFMMIKTMAAGEALTIDNDFKFDKKENKSFLVSESFSTARIKTEDVSYKLNKKKDLYYVADAVQGNEIDDDKLREYVNGKIEEALSGRTVASSETITIAVPDEVYSSIKPKTDKTELENGLAQKNKEYRQEKYTKMTVTYTFGKETEVLDGATLSKWVTVQDDLSVKVDEEAAKAYISELASKYNTADKERTFTTTGGSTITFEASQNEYGYTIDEETELKTLVKDLKKGDSVSREPEYYETNSYGNPEHFGTRNGMDDLNGNYVEIDLSAQYLWFYRDGQCILESYLVSGCIDNGTGTVSGVYPLAYKMSPATLTGSNANDSWSSDVDFWMPFYGGQGLHDATWRSSFGGDIYIYDGSHGCVNLPYSSAQTIYNNITAGTAIVLYY